MNEFLDKIKKQQELNLPFVIYRKPNSDTVLGLFQQNDSVYQVRDFAERGFVFASFDGNQTVLIPDNQSEKRSAIYKKEPIEVAEKEFSMAAVETKNNFESLVCKGIQAIVNREFQKVVLSRKETIDLANFDLIATFIKLKQSYPTAFVYCFSHPKVGIWLGATPEQLVKATGAVFETMALAGTQKGQDSNEVVWGDKEKEEQQFVTDYVVSKLKGVADEVLISDPYSVKAGSLWHIKTTISGVLNSDSGLKKVIELLHPTPAVCGFPKDSSKSFIGANENYDRSFYTGYLGELNSTSIVKDTANTDLFVNLRCMQIEITSKSARTKAHLYVGCGITKDSIPEKEWIESVYKTMTMKSVL